MPTKHVIDQIEGYLDQRLSDEARRRVEEHIENCPSCARYYSEARYLATQLEPTLRAALGEPTPPAGLHYRVREAVEEASDHPPLFSFPWHISGRLLNAAGTMVVIILLAFGAFLVVRTQLPPESTITADRESLPLANGGNENSEISPPSTPLSQIQNRQSISTPRATASLRETLPELPFPNEEATNQDQAGPVTPPPITPSGQPKDSEIDLTLTEDGAGVPGGTIAFSFFNPAPDRQVYEIHLVDPAGTNHRLFPLDGVSEPALRHTEKGYSLAYRAWAEPTAPRSLLTSDLDGQVRNRVGGYWEDAQPDWSPIENRLIFASQRETDRRWRLYTSWGDGLAEKELRREGKSPSFGPDGHHFVFEGCDKTGNRCGLWLGNLADSEYGSQPILENPQAKSPDWAPEADQIAFMASLNDNWDLYLVGSDGKGEPRRLTSDPAIDGLPAWSPDGHWLAFLSNRGGNWGIWILHVQTGQIRQVYEFDGGIFTPPKGEPYGDRNWQDEQISWSR